MVTLRRIDPVSSAKVSAAVYGALSLLFALPMGCLLSVVGSSTDAGVFGAGLGLIALVSYPLAGAIGGFVMGFLSAIVYNFVADRVGGIELELDGYVDADDAF